MIESIIELLEWMDDVGVSTKGIEVTIHFPTGKAKHHFMYSLQRELTVFHVDLKASLPNELKIFRVPVHLRVKDDHI